MVKINKFNSKKKFNENLKYQLEILTAFSMKLKFFNERIIKVNSKICLEEEPGKKTLFV